MSGNWSRCCARPVRRSPAGRLFRTVESTGVDEVQKMLEPDEVLVEYYTIEDRFYAFVIARDAFDVVPDLTTTGAVRQSLKGLNFQLSKFHLKPSYIEAHMEMLFRAT